MSNPRTRIPSPARSQGAPVTPRRHITSRRSKSVNSPARTVTTRLSQLVQEHNEEDKSSFLLSPITRKSLLPDDTNIEMPGRPSWWKNLNDNSRDVFEVLKETEIERHNIMDELNIEVLSQEETKHNTLDLPESDNESIHSIIIPQKKIFNQKENQPKKRFDNIGNRKTLDRTSDTNDFTDKSISVTTKELFQNKQISRPAFPAALLDVSSNTTATDKTLTEAIKPKGGIRNMFGTQQPTKRKNMFAEFINTSEYSSDEIVEDIPEIKKKFFNIERPTKSIRAESDEKADSKIISDQEKDIRIEHEHEMEPETELEIEADKKDEQNEAESDINEISVSNDMNCQKPAEPKNYQAAHSESDKEEELDLDQENDEPVAGPESERKEGPESEQERKPEGNKETEPKVFQEVDINVDIEMQPGFKHQDVSKEVNNKQVAGTESIEAELESDQKVESECVQKIASKIVQNAHPIHDQKANPETAQEAELEHGHETEPNSDIEVEPNKDQEIEQNNYEEMEIENCPEVEPEIDQQIAQESEQKIKQGDDQEVEQESDIELELASDQEVEQENDQEVEHESDQEVEPESDQEVEPESDQEVEQESDQEVEPESDQEVEPESDQEVEPESDQEVEPESDQEVEQENDEEVEQESDQEVEQESGQEVEQKSGQELEQEIDREVEQENDQEEEPGSDQDIEPEADQESDQEGEVEDDREANQESNQEVVPESDPEVEHESDQEVDQESDQEAEAESDQEMEPESNQEVELESDLDVEPEFEQDVSKVENNEQVANPESDQDQENQNNEVSAIDNTLPSNTSHDTTGRNRKKNEKTIEAGVFRPTKALEHSFIARGRNTSVRKSKSLIEKQIEPEEITIKNSRGSISLSESGKNSSAEGSGWDSHRTTRKTLRQTFGKDFTPRKSLRALVMEKSARRTTKAKNNEGASRMPLANSTELHDASLDNDDYEMQENALQSTPEVSLRTRKATLEEYLQKVKRENDERRAKMAEAVRKQIEQRINDAILFKMPRPLARKSTKPKPQAKKPISEQLQKLPKEFQEDLNYKPPKRFAPRNAPWMTKNFYKFIESKLEPKYDYKARVRAEKFAMTLHGFVQSIRKLQIAPPAAVAQLAREMARLDIVTTYFEFYNFFSNYMPREVIVKVVPDIVNKIPQPRNGVFSQILQDAM